MDEKRVTGRVKHAIDLTIQLNRDKPHVYRSGEVISGCVRLETNEILSVKVLLIELLGRAVVVAPCPRNLKIPWWWSIERKALHRRFFTHQTSGYVVSLPSKCSQTKHPKSLELESLCQTPPVSMRRHNTKFRTVNEEIVCSHIVTLLGGNTPGSCEAVVTGEHCYPFLFHLPESCPCSFSGTRGSVEYRLKTTLHLSTGSRYRSNKGFVVIRDVVIGQLTDIPSTLSCPPVSRHFVSSFDLLNSSNAMDQLTSLVRQKFSNSRFASFESLNSNGESGQEVQSRMESLGSTTMTRPAKAQYLSAPSHQHLELDKQFEAPQMQPTCEKDDWLWKKNSITLKDRIKWIFTGNKRAVLLLNDPSQLIQYSQCYATSCLVPASWISRPYTSELSSYPRMCTGSQTGYAVSCRLTINRRNVVPGERLTGRLTLFVEDPFALVPLPDLAKNGCSLGGCLPCCCSNPRHNKRIWSPLAKAFVSYFLEESYQQELIDPYDASLPIWWKGVVKQPYRIYIILRQMTTYTDWTNHIIAEEERDIYTGEMERSQPTDKHLLRVGLEHVFNVPAVTPSGLDGTHCITVMYTLGVVFFKLKKHQYLWSPNEWKLHLDRKIKHLPMRAVEHLFIPNSSDVESSDLNWSKRFVRHIQRRKSSAPTSWKQIYSNLLLSIPIRIGTTKYGQTPGGDHEILHIANDTLHPCHFMQWPYSCEQGSVPPVYVFNRQDSGYVQSLLQMRSGLESATPISSMHPSSRSGTAERRRRSHSLAGRVSTIRDETGKTPEVPVTRALNQAIMLPVNRRRHTSVQFQRPQRDEKATRSTWQHEVQI